ncbi:hypothetical protein Mapa_016750 [Marchantia paleacea]|nr:hypothetical protein Mapa_016750 [Marchantia paleacea]
MSFTFLRFSIQDSHASKNSQCEEAKLEKQPPTLLHIFFPITRLCRLGAPRESVYVLGAPNASDNREEITLAANSPVETCHQHHIAVIQVVRVVA